MIQVCRRVIGVSHDQMPSLCVGGSIKELPDIDVVHAGTTSSLSV